jgi:hypothetical protein
MKPKNGIKIRFQRAAANTNPQMDKVVLEDVLTAYKKTLGRKLTYPQLKIWRIIMKSPITKLAAAAVVLVAFFIGLTYWLPLGEKQQTITEKVVRKGSTTPNAPGLARQPKSPIAAVAPRDGDRTFATRAPASRNRTLAIQAKPAASGSEAGLAGALDAEQTVAKSPIIYKLRLTQVLEDLQGKVFRHNDTAEAEILLEAEVLRVFKGDPKAAGQRVVLVWDTVRSGPRLYSCLHAEQVVPKHVAGGETVYLMALTPAEPPTDAEGRLRLKNIFCLDIMGTRVSKADVDPKKRATAKNTLEQLKLELLSALDDPDANTRHSAIKGLRRWDGQKLSEEPPGGPLWKDGRAAARILAASRDPDWRVRWVVAWMIPKEAAEEGEKALVRLLSDTHREIRQVAAFVLRRRGREDLVKPLLDEPPTDPPPIRSTIPEPQGGRQRLDDQEKVILTTQRGEEAADAKRDDQTPPVRPLSEAELDGKEILKKLKSSDAVYEAAFTASGTRPGWPVKKKWKLTMLHGEIVYQEEVVETAKADVPRRTRLRRPGGTEGKSWLVFRRTVYVGPKVQAEHDWVGRIQRYGPLDPWPKNSPGPATAGVLSVVKPDAPTYMLLIKQPLLCLGRGYSRYVTEIKDASRQADGRLKVTADGIDIAYRPGAKWELVIAPDEAYMVRSAKMVDNRKLSMSISNSGLKWYGSRCVPEKAECKGKYIDASFEIQSASSEADTEFLKNAKDTMRPPYLIHTDVSDQRVTPRLHISYDAGKVSPNGRIKDWDIGLEDPKQPATQWGEAVEGVQCRLRAEKIIWQSGKWPKFRADLRNHGERKLYRSGAPQSWEIELDGVWYRATVLWGGTVGMWSLFPGKE